MMSSSRSSKGASLAQQLALMAQEPKDAGWGLRAGVVTREVEAVTMLVDDGSAVWTAVHVGAEARERLNGLSRWYGDGPLGGDAGGGLLDQARQFVTVVVVVVMLFWCCGGGVSGRGDYRVVDGRE